MRPFIRMRTTYAAAIWNQAEFLPLFWILGFYKSTSRSDGATSIDKSLITSFLSRHWLENELILPQVLKQQLINNAVSGRTPPLESLDRQGVTYDKPEMPLLSNP